jgi:hypothetical protein
MSQDNATNKEPASEPTPKLRLRDLLWGLFFFPHVILPLVVVPGAWGRAWRIFTTFFILSALLLAFVHLPRYREIAAGESARLAAQVRQIKVEEHGRLVFPLVKPGAEISCQDVSCVIHFAKPGQALAPDEIKAKDLWCFWIGDKVICVMHREDVDSAFRIVMTVDNGDWPWETSWAGRYFAEINSLMVPGTTLKEGQIAALFLEIHQFFIPGFFFFDRVVVYFTMLVMMIMISAMLWLFPGTRVLGDGKIGTTLSLFFYAGIPALAVATIWGLVPGASLDSFLYIYLWTLAGYLLVVLFVLRRMAAAAGGDDDDSEG